MKMFFQWHLEKALCDSLIYISKRFGTAFCDDQAIVFLTLWPKHPPHIFYKRRCIMDHGPKNIRQLRSPGVKFSVSMAVGVFVYAEHESKRK
jgi:hypothetical protein